MYKILKLDLNKLSVILVMMIYSNVLKLVGAYQILSLLIELWLIFCIIYHIINIGIKKNNLMIFTLVFILLCLSLIEIFNPNITSLGAGFMGFRKTSIAWNVFLAALLVEITEEKVSFFVRKIIIWGFPILLYGVKQVLFFNEFDNKFIQNNSAGDYTGKIFGEVRMTSVFSGGAHLGAFSVVMLMLVIYYWKKQFSLKTKTILSAIAVSSLVCVYGSLSRTMVVVLIVCLLVFFILKSTTITRVVLLFFTVLLFSIYNILNNMDYFQSWLVSNNPLLRMLGTIINASSDSRLLGRGVQANELVELVKQHLIIGYGIGSSEAATYLGYITHIVSDNLYLSYLMETGVFGFVLLLFILFYISFRLLKNKRTKFLKVVISIFFGTLIMGFTGTTTAMYPVIQIIFALLGIGISSQQKKRIS